jgi:hypothetical protein
MIHLFVFSKDDKLLGDFYFDSTLDITSELEKWASKERILIPRLAYATAGDKKWTVIESNPLKIISGVASESEIESDIIVNSSRQNEILLKILETQEKQLYWIRIIGIPFFFAAIGTFLALIIRAFN